MSRDRIDEYLDDLYSRLRGDPAEKHAGDPALVLHSRGSSARILLALTSAEC